MSVGKGGVADRVRAAAGIVGRETRCQVFVVTWMIPIPDLRWRRKRRTEEEEEEERIERRSERERWNII